MATPKKHYRPDIDGLRALAVLAVLLFHADIPGVSGGFVGVDIFFVISGYLITGIILRDLAAGRFSFLTFWERRVRRIVPALAVMVFATLVAGYFLLLFPIDFREVGQSVFAQSLFLANFFFVRNSGYFAQDADTIPLLHTWSLSVEEQFYIIVPVLLWLLYRYAKKWMGIIVSFFALVSVAIAYYLVSHAPTDSFFVPGIPNIWGNATNASAAFYLLPARAFELLIGVLLACIPLAISKRYVAEGISLLGVAAMFYAIIIFDSTTPFPGLAALIPTLGAAAFMLANTNHRTLAGQLFSFPLFVGIGLISYSLYLWHWPLLVFAKLYTPVELSHPAILSLIAASFAAAYLSYRFVETPFRTKQLLAGRAVMLIVGLLTLGSLAGLGLLVAKKDGLPERSPAAALSIAAAATDFHPRRNECFVNSFQISGEPCYLGQQKVDDVSVMLWGDSHAGGFFPLVDELASEYDKSGASFISPDCQPATIKAVADKTTPCANVTRLANAFLEAQNIDRLILVARWGDAEDTLPAVIEQYHKQVERIIIVQEPPRHLSYSMRDRFTAAAAGKTLPDKDPTYLEYTADRAAAISLLTTVANLWPVTIINPSDILCPDQGICRPTYNDTYLYYDTHHLNVSGVRLLKPLLEPVFK